ncbi:MAG: DUF723 domain-containing protein [Bryobacterales bacterium]|nr:DUF723 domain-containing protein [Bryobacterales bacterium]
MGITTEDFIKRAQSIHGGRYHYDQVVYVRNTQPIQICCTTHGSYLQRPDVHLRGNGCPRCSGKAKKDTALFIEDARAVHGDKFDYSRAHYITSKTKLEIVCPVHGSFWQIPNRHLSGGGCDVCGGTAKSNTSQFVEKATRVHGTRFSYDSVEYRDAVTPVTITCPVHGDFSQSPHAHLKGHGCPQCGGVGRKNSEGFIAEALRIHGDRYRYDHVQYVNSKTPVQIGCPKHGYFYQSPNDHLSKKSGCSKCNRNGTAHTIRSGNCVRSGFEAIVFEYLYSREIEFQYETEKVGPFTVDGVLTLNGKTIYLEIAGFAKATGRTIADSYMRQREKKEAYYQQNGIDVIWIEGETLCWNWRKRFQEIESTLDAIFSGCGFAVAKKHEYRVRVIDAAKKRASETKPNVDIMKWFIDAV